MENDGCRELWLSVIGKAIDDATSTTPPPPTLPPAPEGETAQDQKRRLDSYKSRLSYWRGEKYAKETAQDWLLSGGREFQRVCSYASVSASALRSLAVGLEKCGWPKRQILV